MKNSNKSSLDNLLQKAEELLLQQLSTAVQPSTAVDTLKLIHELKVHQIELELQQEQLEHANKAIAAVAEKYTSLYDFAPIGYFSILPNGNIQELNLCGSQLLGKDRNYLKNKYFPVFLEEASKLPFRFFLDQIFTSTAKQTCTVTITNSNNERTHILLTGILVQNENGCLVTATDITDSTIKAAKISDEKGLSEAIVTNLPGIFYLYDDAGNFINWNKNFERITGYTAKEISGMKPLDFYDAQQQQIISERIKSVFDKQNTNGIEVNLLTKEGKQLPFYINSNTIEYAGKTCLMGIGTDISKLKLTENALKESEQKFKMIAENTSDGMVVFNADNAIQYTSPAYLKQLGYSQSEALSKNADTIFQIIHPDDREELYANIFKAIELKKPSLVYSFRIKHIEGHYIWREDNALFKYDENGKFAGANVVCRDISERKQAEKDLQNKNDFIKGIVNNIPGMVGYWTKDLQCTFSNKYYLDWFGRTEEQMYNISLEDLLGKDLFEKNQPFIKGALEGTNQQFERMLVKADGKATYTWAQYIPHKIDGVVVGFFVLVTDITARKELEELLIKAQRIARLGSWEVDLVNNTAYWSEMIKEIHEVEDDYVPNFATAITFIKEGESRELVEKEISESIATGKKWNADLQLITAKGNEVWIRAYGEAELRDGICIRIYGSFQDIDVQKRAEEAIRVTNERYNLVAKATNDALWDWDIVTGKVLRLGRGFNVLFGYDDEEANNDNQFWQKIIHTDDLPLVSNSINAVFNNPNKQYWEAEFRIVKANGEQAFVYDKGFIIRDNNGKPIRMIGATQDVTRLKENELNLSKLNEDLQYQTKELANSNRELEQFAYVASHDLQEPLRMVSSFLTLLEKKYADKLDENGKLYIGYAVDGAKRMRQIILDLLELSRIGRTEGVNKLVDVNKLVQSIIVLYKKLAEEKNASIEVSELPSILGHVASLRQVFLNLIGNALKYSKKNTPVHITISAIELKDFWQFTIADNGIGIAAEYFEKIFVLFQRLNKNEIDGTGIGLAITKKVIESYGGKIWLTSKEGVGTSFYFTIKK